MIVETVKHWRLNRGTYMNFVMKAKVITTHKEAINKITIPSKRNKFHLSYSETSVHRCWRDDYWRTCIVNKNIERSVWKYPFAWWWGDSHLHDKLKQSHWIYDEYVSQAFWSYMYIVIHEWNYFQSDKN